MRVYVNEGKVVIVGRDATIMIKPEHLMIEGRAKKELEWQGTSAYSFGVFSSQLDSIKDYDDQVPLVIITDFAYEVGQQYSAGELKKTPPPNGTIIRDNNNLPLLFNNGSWQYGSQYLRLVDSSGPFTVIHVP